MCFFFLLLRNESNNLKTPTRSRSPSSPLALSSLRCFTFCLAEVVVDVSRVNETSRGSTLVSRLNNECFCLLLPLSWSSHGAGFFFCTVLTNQKMKLPCSAPCPCPECSAWCHQYLARCLWSIHSLVSPALMSPGKLQLDKKHECSGINSLGFVSINDRTVCVCVSVWFVLLLAAVSRCWQTQNLDVNM